MLVRGAPKRTVAAVQRASYDAGMLRRLRIENLVLIRDAELELDPGLNAITGETGAGKTILSNAIGLLLGAPIAALDEGDGGGDPDADITIAQSCGEHVDRCFAMSSGSSAQGPGSPGSR